MSDEHDNDSPDMDDQQDKGAFAPLPGGAYLDADPSVLSGLLEWYQAMGVDLAMEDAPLDRFAVPKTAAPRPTASPPSPASPHATTAPTDGPISNPLLQDETAKPKPPPQRIAGNDEVDQARNAAQAAQNLDELRQSLEGFDACPLKRHADKLVFGEGPTDATYMIVGGAPRRDDDLAGLPFQGQVGSLLEKIMTAIGIDLTTTFRTNILPWRPAGDRPPSPIERDICLPFFERQVELVQPKFILCLGGQATNAVLAREGSILRLRGQVHEVEVGGHKTQAFATLHPSHLLNKPAQKALVWHDMLKFKRAIHST